MQLNFDFLNFKFCSIKYSIFKLYKFYNLCFITSVVSKIKSLHFCINKLGVKRYTNTFDLNDDDDDDDDDDNDEGGIYFYRKMVTHDN